MYWHRCSLLQGVGLLYLSWQTPNCTPLISGSLSKVLVKIALVFWHVPTFPQNLSSSIIILPDFNFFHSLNPKRFGKPYSTCTVNNTQPRVSKRLGVNWKFLENSCLNCLLAIDPKPQALVTLRTCSHHNSVRLPGNMGSETLVFRVSRVRSGQALSQHELL